MDKSGAKRWIQRIVIKGKRTDLGLGSIRLVSLAAARELAIENRSIARSGDDPLRLRRAAMSIPTFEEAARKVYEIHRPSWRNAKHAKQFISTLETYAFPKLGPVKVDAITTADTLAVLQPIWLVKPETARRLKQRMGKVFDWTVAHGWRESNPTLSLSEALPRQDRHQNHRKTLPYDQVADCLAVVRSSKAFPTTVLTFEFLVHTATRSNEVRNAVWSEIDPDTGSWTIPRERMKQKKEHRIPLTPETQGILAQAKAFEDASGLIFPSPRTQKAISDATLLKLLREQNYPFDIHGFRTSFKTWAQERTNISREVSEAALSHTIKNKAEAAYARSDLFEKRRELMSLWSRYITHASAEVIKITGN